ncbi:hypothetical protein M427DRAFT_136327 [Gonapodya prolifera JEL478]|uniref:Ubiquitin-like domain-containing protein n=1 Tax=Gonapodya prolifera (strain JEL478) TaxID=1344416 RepID=A0A139AB96_GONPJ|nr:hypothetical protein M427DRAFT_136327 [Gonapodya prolifera JEL478]|eukprot:KXS13735.1 hypothetical protein M427DRAFT_136327 [Gonapodya prolifera JEL478]
MAATHHEPSSLSIPEADPPNRNAITPEPEWLDGSGLEKPDVRSLERFSGKSELDDAKRAAAFQQRRASTWESRLESELEIVKGERDRLYATLETILESDDNDVLVKTSFENLDIGLSTVVLIKRNDPLSVALDGFWRRNGLPHDVKHGVSYVCEGHKLHSPDQTVKDLSITARGARIVARFAIPDKQLITVHLHGLHFERLTFHVPRDTTLNTITEAYTERAHAKHQSLSSSVALTVFHKNQPVSLDKNLKDLEPEGDQLELFVTEASAI